ncbi:uncharacterized protein LOC123508905 [Portunus trituberculatus]|uniref:uncharacterized protein LOC123508905 n=1 Tax=Portunus trituberculatus TaxID=210409 RepID=UPI001E1CDAD3|nr:uncharacterized protein LOC123508905 [Portunus trituberculatus]
MGECPTPSSMPEPFPNLPDPVYLPPTTTPSTTTAATIAQDPTTTAKTTMRLLEGSSGSEGVEVSGAVPLGTRLTLVVSAYSRDLPLDLHLAKCEARDEEGRVVVLLKDGCSVSQVLEDFREVVEADGEPGVRRVSQYAKLRVFNTRAAPQNITLLCFLKVCSGECAERPACVHSDINLGRSKRPVPSLYSRQVTLAKVFRVAGFPVNRPTTPPVLSSKSPGDKPECDCSHVAGVEAAAAGAGRGVACPTRRCTWCWVCPPPSTSWWRCACTTSCGAPAPTPCRRLTWRTRSRRPAPSTRSTVPQGDALHSLRRSTLSICRRRTATRHTPSPHTPATRRTITSPHRPPSGIQYSVIAPQHRRP